ncbi:DNA polymerase delta subunit 2 [Episyrphus balteatus]|uniref:DNA polymerase delta subunit 2 n=1 Tax=Episyrphus balteatus TaxID=286459 RepID=UPI0024868961|nr:DNA polymerase delta subunit 2 [Episyrphus balteatus]
MSSKINRLEISYKNLSDKFLITTQNYQMQFSHLYAHRLSECTKLLTPKVLAKWGTEFPIKKLCELREDVTEKCILIGTLFKHQAFKPSILREISEENQLAPQPPRQHYADSDDKLILEDELQRVRLFGQINVRFMATGVVCAVLGTIEDDGKFIVEDTVFLESGPQRELASLPKPASIILISGLNQIHCHEFSESLNMFQHWLSGNIDPSVKNCTRLIIAGNSVRSCAERKQFGLQMKSSESNDTVLAVKNLDKYFASWSQSIYIDLMPGEFDPATFMLPQQPFHRCMFPQASRNSSFHSVSNPYACEIGNRLVVGTSGQNVRDLLRNTNLEDPLEALRSTLQWGHISPTSPDTLACYPYVESDPFIMKECPSVYFVGNCDEFKTEIHNGSDGQKTRIVCVPEFSKTQSIAVVDLDSLNCRSVSFKVVE